MRADLPVPTGWWMMLVEKEIKAAMLGRAFREALSEGTYLMVEQISSDGYCDDGSSWRLRADSAGGPLPVANCKHARTRLNWGSPL